MLQGAHFLSGEQARDCGTGALIVYQIPRSGSLAVYFLWSVDKKSNIFVTLLLLLLILFLPV